MCVSSFDHLVGAGEQWQRDCYAKRLGSLEVQEHLDLRRLLNRQLARLFAFEDTGGVDASQTVSVGKATAIAHQAAGGDELADRKSTRLNSSHLGISYAVFCLKKK